MLMGGAVASVMTSSLSSAGLDDMVLSALVKEQMEGLTPAAIALIPPRKMAVRASPSEPS